MQTLLLLLLILIIVFQLFRIRNTIINGDKISSGRNFYIGELELLFKIIEQSNPGANIKLYSGKIPPLEVIKKQDHQKWWIEISTRQKQMEILNEQYGKLSGSSNREIDNINNEISESTNFGYNIKIIVNSLKKFYETTLRFSDENYVTVAFNNTAIDDSVLKNIHRDL